MADNSFRPFRRDAPARDADVSRDGGDPLAELARLIGQGDPNGQSRDTRQDDTYEDAPPASDLDWASGDDGYAEQRQDDGYAPRAEGYRSNQSDTVPWPRDPEYDDEPAPPSQYAWPPAALTGGGRDEPRRNPPPMQEPRHHEEPRLPGARPQPASYISAAPEGFRPGGRDQFAEQAPSYSEDYAEDEYDDTPPRRSGTVVILAVLGLAVLGTAGAFGYRAMFGSIAPSLPPIIRPGDGPIKIQPGPQGAAPNQAETNNAGSGEHVVTRQEQPVDLPPGNTAPRVITTIPVVSNSGDGGVPGPQGQSLPPGSVAPGQAFPPPPMTAPNGQPQAYVGGPDQMAAPTAPSPPGGTHSVQTLTIRTDQGGRAAPQTVAPAPPPAAAPQRPPKPHVVAKPRPVETAAGGPLSIVPNQQGEPSPPPPRMRTAMAHPQGSAAPVDLSGGAPSGGGSYAVQVSSQRSEAEAEAAYRSLQARYPQQLGGRHAMIRRADLGARGIYYRALVGPFASSEQAAGVCSSIKAAGGSCLIQRN